ncbi:50S ribosomal protein L25 [candidate division KSB1 bacterium]|nr:50S ribosomal protein L25 [candidate division KSB1 bacterium]
MESAMEDLKLHIYSRTETGKGAAKRLRREGNIPGVYYYHGRESIPIYVSRQDFVKLVHHGNITVVDAILDDKEPMQCIIRDTQIDPTLRLLAHIDFMGVKTGEKITVTVPLQLKGQPVGVRSSGGILNHILREIELYCLPKDIPEFIEIDVENLEIGDSIDVSQISAGEYEILTEPERVIAAVTAPRMEEEEEEGEEEEALEPEVIGKESEEEEEEEE